MKMKLSVIPQAQQTLMIIVWCNHALMNMPQTHHASVLCLWSLDIGWKVLDSDILSRTGFHLRCTSQQVLNWTFFSLRLFLFYRKKALDWEWTWRFFLYTLTTPLLTSSTRLRFNESGAWPQDGIFLIVKFLDLMNFLISLCGSLM